MREDILFFFNSGSSIIDDWFKYFNFYKSFDN